MAKVFLSYARPDRPLPAQLAPALERAGHAVWWDAKLLAGNDFAAVIDRELSLSDAAVVIWTPLSIKSSFVNAEAQKARDASKLVSVLGAAIRAADLPVPFNARHAVGIGDVTAILRAIDALDSAQRQQTTASAPVTGYSANSKMLTGGVALIRRMAQIVFELAEDTATDPQQAEALRIAVADLTRAMDTFVSEVTPDDSYSIDERFIFRRVVDAIQAARPAIAKEKMWLDAYSSAAVIENARAGLGTTARTLLQACG